MESTGFLEQINARSLRAVASSLSLAASTRTALSIESSAGTIRFLPVFDLWGEGDSDDDAAAVIRHPHKQLHHAVRPPPDLTIPPTILPKASTTSFTSLVSNKYDSTPRTLAAMVSVLNTSEFPRCAMTMPVEDLCSLHSSIAKRSIVSIARRRHRSGVQHEFILVRIRSVEGGDLWIRLDREAERVPTLKALLGIFPANDTVSFDYMLRLVKGTHYNQL